MKILKLMCYYRLSKLKNGKRLMYYLINGASKHSMSYPLLMTQDMGGKFDSKSSPK